MGVQSLRRWYVCHCFEHICFRLIAVIQLNSAFGNAYPLPSNIPNSVGTTVMDAYVRFRKRSWTKDVFIYFSGRYTMSLLGIDVTTPITLRRRDMENAVSRVVAEVIWLGMHPDRTKRPHALTQTTAGEVGASDGGFGRIEVESSATQQVLELRLNVSRSKSLLYILRVRAQISCSGKHNTGRYCTT
jgi:hypothetical protein